MNQYQLKNKNQGFTLFEIIFVVAVFSVISVSVATFTTWFEKSKAAQNYAHTTYNYGQAYKDYIVANYNTVYQQAQINSTLIIPFSAVKTAGLDKNMPVLNRYNQSPCVGVQYNSQLKNLTMILFYTTDDTTEQYDKYFKTINFSNDAMSNLDGGAGRYDIKTNTMMGYGGKGGGSWQLEANKTADLIAKAIQCDAHAIAPNSLAYNIAIMSAFPANLEVDASVHRDGSESGLQAPLQLSNRSVNDATPTAIVLGSNTSNNAKIMLGSSNSTTLKQTYQAQDTTFDPASVNPNTAMVSGQFQSDGIVRVRGLKKLGDPCAKTEIGAIARDTDDPNYTIPHNQLICTYNKLACPNQSYCYLSSFDYKITYNVGVGHTSVQCPISMIVDQMSPITYGFTPSTQDCQGRGSTDQYGYNKYSVSYFKNNMGVKTFAGCGEYSMSGSPVVQITNDQGQVSPTGGRFLKVNATLTWSNPNVKIHNGTAQPMGNPWMAQMQIKQFTCVSNTANYVAPY